MNCDQFQNNISDYLANSLSKKNRRLFENHSEHCTRCQRELEELRKVWEQLQNMPQAEPSSGLRSRFYEMLQSFKEELKQEPEISFLQRLGDVFEKLFPIRPSWQLGKILLVLIFGLVVGRYGIPAETANQKYSQLQSEIKNMRQLVSLTLLKQNSAGDRLMGISYSQGIEKPETPLLSALFNTLNNDPNVNVRLAAANALYLFSDQVDTRTKLIESLALQKSPLVQISLINMLVEVREKKALEALNQLLQNQTIFPEVKNQAEWGMDQLKNL